MPRKPSALRGTSGFDLPFAAPRKAPNEAVVAACSAGDDVMPHQVAGHAARKEHPKHGVDAGVVGLRVAPRVEVPDPRTGWASTA